MVFTGLFAAVITVCIVSVSTQDRSVFPKLTLTPNVLQDSAAGQSCPSHEIRQSARNEISSSIITYLRFLTNPGATEGSAAESCQQIAQLRPNTTSDYYWIRTANGSATHLYCDMSNRCGRTQVAFTNMSDSSQSCPSGLAEVTHNGVRVCQRMTNFACDSTNFSVPFSYNKVCGRIVGYQVGSTDAFCPFQEVCHYRSFFPSSLQAYTIDDAYVDGLSLTHGHPREHIWTFAAAISDVYNMPAYACPCTRAGLSAIVIPPFVGNDYFCDTGNHENRYNNGHFYGDDPLWDGAGCGATGTCCSFNTPPWFTKQLPSPTNDPLELRSCGDQQANTDENVGIQLFELYVQ